MNGFLKVLYAILAGCNVIFNLFAPIAIVLLWILEFGSQSFGSSIIILLGCFAVIYRALDFIMLKKGEED